MYPEHIKPTRQIDESKQYNVGRTIRKIKVELKRCRGTPSHVLVDTAFEVVT